MSQKTIAVAVVEDAAGTRENLVTLLNRAAGIRCVGDCASGEAALRDLPALLPEVVLMDINLPGISGIECVSALKSKLPRSFFLMLTAYEDADMIFASLQAGASGYLMKNVDPGEIIQAIEQVHAGGAPMSMQIARKVVNYFQQLKKPSPDVQQLTKREQEILALLAKGYLYKEIAEQLGISLHTVRGHIHVVYEKLHVQSRTEAVLRFLGQK